MPLVRHLEHTAAVAALLWDRFFPASVKSQLAASIGVTLEEAKTLYCWYAALHDTGKASNDFARQALLGGGQADAAGILSRMSNEGLSTRDGIWSRVRHELVSQLAVTDWLEEVVGMNRIAAGTWACVLGGHHGKNPDPSQVAQARNSPDALGRGRWVEVRREIIDTMTERTGVLPLLVSLQGRRMPVPAQALMTSMVVVADWMASNQGLFPYFDELPPTERAVVAFDQLTLPAPWSPHDDGLPTDSLLNARFPDLGTAAARPIQTALVASARTCSEPPLLIVEAPMGNGKTEAALLASEILAARFGQGGVFVGLPTMATANPMFDRVLDWLSTAVGREKASVALVHGKAGLNDHYSSLIREAWRGQVYDDEDADNGRPVVNGWLSGRRKAGLASFVVGTIDQGLFLGLKAKHVALRHLGFAGKVVVFDEVHAADTYMRQYLKRVLTWLGAYQTPVILMSATLPPDHRDEFVAAYAAGRGVPTPPPTGRDDAYPRLTVYDRQLAEVEVDPGQATTRVGLARLSDDPDAVVALLRERLREGGCAGVICNTVGRAQELYGQLRLEFGSDVMLAHSRFIAPARAASERKLVEKLGRDGRRPERLIVVGTQVLEQSLDVDFDLLVTDVAPIDLVLQRAGRLHRHLRSRPPLLVAPTLYLRGVTDWTAEPPALVSGSVAVYGRAGLLRSLAVLAGRDSVTLPTDIPTLVRLGYDKDVATPATWAGAIATADTEEAKRQSEARSRASAYLVDAPGRLTSLTGWLDVKTPDPDRSEEQGRSQVRDSEDSLEIIALTRDTDGTLRLPDCAPRHAGAAVPTGLAWGTAADESLAKAMASCTLSLPITMTNAGAFDRVVAALENTVDYAGWQDSSWIKGQLAVPFDPDGHARIADFDLAYTPELGLTVTRHKEER